MARRKGLPRRRVAKWTDSSGNKNDAVPLNAKLPKVNTGALNGYSSVLFDNIGSILSIPDAVTLHFGTDDLFIVAVARQQSKGTSAFLYSKAAYGSLCVGGCVYQSGLQFLFILYVDDQQPRTVTQSGNTVDDGDAGTAPLQLGGDPGFPMFAPTFSFEIVELVVVHAPAAIVADDAVTGLLSYLKTRYAL